MHFQLVMKCSLVVFITYEVIHWMVLNLENVGVGDDVDGGS